MEDEIHPAIDAVSTVVAGESGSPPEGAVIDPERAAEIRRLFYAEHWRIGTIASQLGIHHDAIDRILARPAKVGECSREPRACLTDPFLGFLAEKLAQYPTLRATVLHRMLEERGYSGSVVQLRRVVRQIRPVPREAFLSLRTMPGEEAQVDWADFGAVSIGRAKRRLSGFVMTLSFSRAVYLEFFLDQTIESFLLGHLHAFESFGGVARSMRMDNLRAAVLERRGAEVRYNPRYLDLAAHYHFQPNACRPARGNEKGRVERTIRYIRDSFFAARSFTTLDDTNAAARRWIEAVAMQRDWPSDHRRKVGDVLATEERPHLLSLPEHPLDTTRRQIVRSGKTIYVRFDRNDYSIPPDFVGKDLGLLTSPTEVRMVDGTTEIARHRRSWDEGDQITDPQHASAVLASKRAALGHARSSPLTIAVPQADAFLDAAMCHGHMRTATAAAHLTRLLNLYGAAPLSQAIREALDRGTPTLASVDYIIERNRRTAQRPLPLEVDLADRPELEAIRIRPQSLDRYDRLTRSHNKTNKDGSND